MKAILFVTVILVCQGAFALDSVREPQGVLPLSYLSTYKEDNATLLTPEMQKTLFDDFRQAFFSVWTHEDNRQKDEYEFTESFHMLASRQWYKENLKPYTNTEFAHFEHQLSGDWLAHSQNAIVIKNTDLRQLPTQRPFFKNPSLPGEGYPFDYLQNSRLQIATPIRVLRLSADTSYVFAISPLGYGWIDSRDIAYTDHAFEQFFITATLQTPSRDGDVLLDRDSLFVESLNVGTLLPFVGGITYYPHRTRHAMAVWEPAKTNTVFISLPKSLRISALTDTTQAISSRVYGWGGYLDNRDCSMFLHDLFVPFGIFLPRNSAEQAAPYKAGYIDLSSLNDTDKEAYIAKHAKPWRSVFALKGHIMLFLGLDDQGNVIALHDTWGIKRFDGGKEGRYLLGGVSVTTLEPGKGALWYDEEKSSLLHKIMGMRDIY